MAWEPLPWQAALPGCTAWSNPSRAGFTHAAAARVLTRRCSCSDHPVACSGTNNPRRLQHVGLLLPRLPGLGFAPSWASVLQPLAIDEADLLRPSFVPFPVSSLAFVHRIAPKSASWALRSKNLQSRRCPEAASAPMPRLFSSSRPLLSLMASTTPWWPPALVQQLFPLMVSNAPRVCRDRFHRELGNMSTISRVKGMSNSGVKDDIISQNNKHSAIAESIRNIEKRDIITISEVVAGDERTNKDACKTTLEVPDTRGQIVNYLGCEEDQRRAPADQRGGVVVSDVEGYTVNILAKSTHRDGSIYRGMDTWWKKEYRIADRNETRLEAMRLSESADCIFYDGTCVAHYPGSMLQFFSIKVANISLAGGSAELYGYIATRDDIDPLLNYVFSFSRDDPIIVRQGSFINMTGPKRGIDICDSALIEYDLRIKTGEQEKDDLQLIDGVSILGLAGIWNRPFSIRIPGDCGAVEIILSRLEPAVEATIDVLVSEVKSSFNLSLGCLTSGLIQEIQLFEGAISETFGLKRSVVAVVIDDLIDVKFKVGVLPSNSDELRCTFEAKTHGHDTQEMKTDFALLSVKVTWSTLPRGTLGL